MNEQARSQQFYLRVLLAIGLLWGCALLVQLLVYAMTPGKKDPLPTSLAFVFNCLTVAPGCLLAFWRRRAACAWLVLDAILAAAYAIRPMPGAHAYGPSLIVSPVVPVLLAASLLVIEFRRWPGALE
jgi:hypothetical protein